MTDEVRLVSELSGDTYKNSVGSEVTIIKIENNILMTAKEMAKLYGVQRPAIYRQLKDIYKSKQLIKKEVSSILTHRADDGKLYRTTFYNFVAIVAVGKNLKSPEAENFVKWLGLSDTKKITA
ncbi:MAG: hypothetical protein LBT19_03040 [Candidatus Nomurabacteria bacterium]|nr:hypothetical protein [Candidatus Nomurabacteria bacterium]